MNTEICQMTKNDLEEISSCYLDEFDNFWNISTLENEISNSNSIYLVLKDNNNIIGFGGIWLGYAGLWQPMDEAHITNIVIRKSKRNQGFGFKLLSELIIIAKKDNTVDLVTLEVNESNIPAIRII